MSKTEKASRNYFGLLILRANEYFTRTVNWHYVKFTYDLTRSLVSSSISQLFKKNSFPNDVKLEPNSIFKKTTE